jgi:hypothetical protein
LYKKLQKCGKNDWEIETIIHHSTRMTQTAEIINEFVQLIENDKDYQLKDLKQMLADVYKTKTAKNKPAKKTVKTDKPEEASDKSDVDDEDKPKKRGRPAKVTNKPKRAPSAYNKYVKERIEKLKIDTPDVPAKDLLKIAAGEWSALSQEQKDSYKEMM